MNRRVKQLAWLMAIPAVWVLAPVQATGQIRNNPGFSSKTLAANDDGSAPIEPLGWTLNFFGRQRTAVFVNNNGNVTFDAALPDYTPFGLLGVSREIIAAFFADVDTRSRESRLVTYGSDTIDGRKAFGVNYIDVGYYNTRADKTNSFQLVLIQREDTGNGNFDIEFNYERITWETGEASGGINGLGGVSAAVGWSNGSGLPGTSFQLPGSLIPGSFLDFGPYSLTRGRTVGRNSLPGRFSYRGRNGQIVQDLTMLTGCPVPNGTVGRAYSFRFEATGSRPPYRWTVTPDADTQFPLSMSATGLLTGVPTRTGEYNFTVRVSANDEDGEVSVSRRCLLTVDPPVVSFRTGTTLPQGVAGSRYETRLLADGAGTPLRFDSLSADIPGLALNSSGMLSGTLPPAGTYAFQARAQGEAGSITVPAIKRFSLTVNPAELSVRATCPLPSGTGGVPYRYQFEARGGSAPYRWTSTGTLPPGVTLTSSGLLQGQPTVPNWWPFDVQVEDSRGQRLEAGCGVLIVYPEIRIAGGETCVLPAANAGASYSQRLSASGGVGPYNWSVVNGVLPPGLRLSTDGTVSGTPLGAQLSQFRVQVRDSRGQQAAAGCSLTVNRGQYSIASCPLPDAFAGETYSYRIDATGGAEPYRFAEAEPLPAGLRLSPDGFLSGVLTTPGTYPVSIRVLDAAGRATMRSCEIRVRPQALRLTTACPLPAASIGENYSTSVTAAGGIPPFQFAAQGLPAGLRVNASGQITGTPTRAGWFPVAFGVTDGAGRSVMQTCELAVGMPELPTLRITGMPATLAPATAGPTVAVELASPYPLDVEGELSLQVTAETGNSAVEINQPDALVRFAGSQSRIAFVIPAGSTRSTQTAQIRTTGTVASALKVQAKSIRSGGVEMLRQAESTGRVPRSAPVLTNVCYAPGSNGFDVEISGYTTTRDLVSAEVTFGSNSYLVDLLGESAGFFADSSTAATGGSFRIRAPYRLAQSTVQTLGQGTAVIRNSAGASASRSISRCQ